MAEVNAHKVEPRGHELIVGLLGASFGTQNLGVAALACGTVASICHSHPAARIFFLDYAREPGTYKISHAGGVAPVELVNIRFSKRFYLPNNIAFLLAVALFLKIVPVSVWREKILRRNAALRAIQEADIIGSLAGGDSFSDIYGIVRLVYVALPQILVLLLGKPLILLPQTLGPFEGLFGKAVARYVTRRAKQVYSRDYESLETAGELIGGDRDRLRFSYDMGFALEPKIAAEKLPNWLAGLDHKVPLVGLNISGLLYKGGYSGNNMFGLKADYREVIQGLIDFFCCQKNANMLLVPHVLGLREDSESDVIACQNAYNATDEKLRGNLHLIEDGYDQHELKALIGRCDFFLGSRMHACIAALSQNVPAVGLAYSRKFRGVFNSIGMDDLVVDLREQDETSIISQAGLTYEKKKEIRTTLEHAIPSVKAQVLHLFKSFPGECCAI